VTEKLVGRVRKTTWRWTTKALSALLSSGLHDGAGPLRGRALSNERSTSKSEADYMD
jgi:hypothetical protein